MRIQIKGGIWKNTEDEILKAAVMKYGLNQWARISSLLVRKSAKQCKARWYEWLDPAIKKTEWTREEDEKLLHLAKLLPTQWRTIAPIVGRTPAQCLDRYEKLLDMAVGKDERYDPADDPRRLRPGEIDPNPESKPAKPDAVDRAEDEKEMLAEARARLANTRGKKAKRKAREKQLEEARRLATLQKRRELKAAGIELRGNDRKGRGVDYNAEVAFERKPAPGFYDVGDEDAKTREMKDEFRPVTIEEMEGKRRKDIEEALVKRDLKRQKLAQEKDAPGLVARINEEAAATNLRRRTKMMLPAPQVSEAELEAIARLGGGGGLEEELLAGGAGGEATRQLLGTYGPAPSALATPMRTPRVGGGAAGGDAVLAAAASLAKLNAMPTPLVGGENPELDPSIADFSGVTPRPAMVAATPNPLAGMTPAGRTSSGGGAIAGVAATPSALARSGSGSGGGSIAGVSMTPSALALPGATPGGPGMGVGGRMGATPLRTPIRDALGLNDADALAEAGAAGGARAAKARAAALRSDLRTGLASLPAPERAESDYMVVPAELEDGEAEDDVVPMEEDAADTKARKAAEAAARAAAEEAKKSAALRRRLPRPVSLDGLPPLPGPPPGGAAPTLRERAEAALAGEMAALLTSDAARYPLAKVGKREKRKGGGAAPAPGPAPPPLADYGLDELGAAAALLEAEVGVVMRAMGHAGVGDEERAAARETAARDVIWLPGTRAYGRAASATPSERVDSTRSEFEALRADMEREAVKAAKLEKKASTVVAGLQGRDEKLRTQLGELSEGLAAARVELACFEALHARELRAAPERIERLAAAVSREREREGELQERYKALLARQGDLMDELRQVAAA